MDPHQQPFPLTPQIQVAPDAIERALADAWLQASEQLQSGPQALVRSCTLNLAIVLPHAELLDEASATITALTVRHPARVLLLVAEPDAAGARLRCAVSVWCRAASTAGPHICCEQVTIDARGEAVGELRALVRALLIPDVPLAVWWRGDWDAKEALFRDLRGMADRLIINSDEFGDPLVALPQLAALHEPRLALADLAWNRLTRWRELTAQFFDAPQQRPYLDRIDHLTLVVSREHRAQALLWLGWLASRLGWTPSAARAASDGYDCTFTSPAGPVHAAIRLSGEGDAYRLELIAAAARFVLACESSGCVRAAVHMPDGSVVRRSVPLHAPDLVLLLSTELDLAGPDTVYAEALAAAAWLAQVLAHG